MATRPPQDDDSCPQFIDYEEDSTSESPERYTHAQLKDFWNRSFTRAHRASTKSWYLKEISLLSKMMQEFSTFEIADMMTMWHKQPLNLATNFVSFYMNRHHVYESIRKKDYGWD